MIKTDNHTIQEIRTLFQHGTRVILMGMADIETPPYRTRGTVLDVDDTGMIHVRWDDGSTTDTVYWTIGLIK